MKHRAVKLSRDRTRWQLVEYALTPEEERQYWLGWLKAILFLSCWADQVPQCLEAIVCGNSNRDVVIEDLGPFQP